MNDVCHTHKTFGRRGIAVAVLVVSLIAAPVFAQTIYAPGQSIVLGDFVYDDDYVATTTANCTISIWGPTGYQEVNQASMTVDANGWYHYAYATTTQGKFPAEMKCGTAGIDLVKQSLTFVVATSSAPSTGDIAAAVNTNIQTASSSLVATIPSAVWSATTRSLTTFGTLAADVWTSGTRTLTGAGLSAGSLATLSDVQSASSSVVAVVNANTNTASTSLAATIPTNVWNATTRSLTTFGTLASDTATAVWAAGTRSLTTFGTLAADVWTSGTRTLTGAGLSAGSLATLSDVQTASSSLLATIPTSVWNVATSTFTGAGTAGKHLVLNLDVPVSTAGGGSLTAADIWTYGTRRLTDGTLNSGSLVLLTDLQTATTSVAAVVNANTNSQVATVNTTVNTASTSLALTIPTNVWNATTRSLTTFGTLTSDTASAVWAAGTRTLTGFGTLAADVWTNGTRTLTGAGLSVGSLATLSDVQTASSSVVALVNANTNTAVQTASTSLATSISAIPANVWAYSTRTLSNFGTLTTDIWNASVRTLTSLSLSNQSPWALNLSNSDTVSAGSNFLATVTTNYNGNLTNSLNTPTVTIYDANRSVVVSSVPMTQTGTGVYTYSYTTSPSAPAGTWETVINATVASGQSLIASNYWTVNTAPPQVLITGMQSTETPNIAANVRITNEGQIDYEYQYEWCVVSNINNACGGGDDVFFASAAKLIHPGDNFDTVLNATVPTAGTYYFKVVVFYGFENSRAALQFAATTPSGNTGGGGGGGGGGGAAVVPPTIPVIPVDGSASCKGADLNGDNRVNTVDFSILLAFWKKVPPYKNTCVDINRDTRVDAQDFSIMLAQWGTRGTALPVRTTI